MNNQQSAPAPSPYNSFYKERDPRYVYPVEFVVRALLGKYPRHAANASVYPGQRVLDLGFGDGRNMPLMHNLGMEIHGVEIAPEICELTAARMERLGISTHLVVGRNATLPFDDAYFDRILACHACYYVDHGQTFADNVREIARVTRSGGEFILSLPKASSYIFSGAEDIGDGHMKIANDPYGVRNGSILKKFDTEDHIRAALDPAFTDVAIGSCQNDFWGVEEHVWTVVCCRTGIEQ
ncbi:MAG: class I SAM-dependent methyltransferase [Devosia sp.]